MKHPYHSIIWGSFGGFLLYVVSILCGELPYINLQSDWLESVLILSCFAVGMVITALVLLIKNPPLMHMLLRYIVYFASYIVFVVLGAQISVVQHLHILFQVREASATDNVSGLLVAIFLIVVFLTSILICIFQTIRVIISCVHKKKTDK